jgi:hypothetical protein
MSGPLDGYRIVEIALIGSGQVHELQLSGRIIDENRL